MALSFDTTYYFNKRPDVLTAWLNSDRALSPQEFALTHYNEFGWKEGYNPNEVFDTNEYLEANPDVAAAGVNPFTHYNEFGQAEGRAPNADFPSLEDFDWEAYVGANPDLQAAGINTAAAAYDHYITFGWNEERPGAPDNAEFKLKKALENLANANDALDAFLELNEVASVSDLEAAKDAAKAALDGDRANGSERELAAKLADAQDAAAAARANLADLDEDILADIADYDALTADLIAAKDVRDALRAASEAEFESFADAQAEADVVIDQGATEITADFGDGPVTIAEFQPFADGSGQGRVVVTSDGMSIEGLEAVVDGINAHLAANDAATAISAERADKKADIDAADTDGLFQNALDREQEVSNAQDAIDARNELISTLADATTLYEQGVALEEAVAAAEKAIEDLGYLSPVVVEGTETGTADENDIFLFGGLNAVDDEIIDFADGDLLFIGNNYSAITVADNANLNGNADFGSLNGLDIFLQQDGNDTLVYVELDTYDGHANGDWAGETIRLVGVDAGDLTFQNGALRYTDTAIA